MKTLANCTPREFLAQTNKIRKKAETWLNVTKILDIRKNRPIFKEGMTEVEKLAAMREQSRKNLRDILDTILDKHPNETAELLGLACFIEPDDLDNHSMAEILASVAEIIDNKDVLSFFTSLARLENLDISGIRKA